MVRSTPDREVRRGAEPCRAKGGEGQTVGAEQCAWGGHRRGGHHVPHAAGRPGHAGRPRRPARWRGFQGRPWERRQTPQTARAALVGDGSGGGDTGHRGCRVSLLPAPQRQPEEGRPQHRRRQGPRCRDRGERGRSDAAEHPADRLGRPGQQGEPEARRRQGDLRRHAPRRRPDAAARLGRPHQHVGGQHAPRHAGGHPEVHGPGQRGRLPGPRARDDEPVARPRRPGVHGGDVGEADRHPHRPLHDDRLLGRGVDGGRHRRCPRLCERQHPLQGQPGTRLRAEAGEGHHVRQGRAGPAVAAHPVRLRGRQRPGPRQGAAPVHELDGPRAAQERQAEQPGQAARPRRGGHQRADRRPGPGHGGQALRPRPASSRRCRPRASP